MTNNIDYLDHIVIQRACPPVSELKYLYRCSKNIWPRFKGFGFILFVCLARKRRYRIIYIYKVT